MCFNTETLNKMFFLSATDIYVFAVGVNLFDEDLQPLTTTKDREKHYFRLKDTNLAQTFEEIIGRSEGFCKLILS